MSADDERRLAAAIAAGDQAAREELALANLGLVGMVARRYLRPGVELEFDDLFGEGLVGLVMAIDRFDPAAHSDVRFSTYATYWIRQRIGLAISATGPIRLPAYLRLRLAQVAWAERTGAPMPELTPEQRQLIDMAGSLRYERLQEEGVALEREPGKASADLEGVDVADSVAVLAGWLDQLNTRARLIIAKRYGLDGEARWTLRRLGRHLGVSAEQVRRIEGQALEQLRELARAEAPGGGDLWP